MNKLFLYPISLGFLQHAHCETKSPWDITGAASLSHASGNSDSTSHSLRFLAKYAEGKHEASFGSEWLYSESDGDTATDSFRLHGQYNRLTIDNFFYSTNASYLTDKAADLDYRGEFGLGFGYYLIKNDKTSLSLEAGPGIAWEEQGGVRSELIVNRFVQRFEHDFNERTKLWQSIAFTPEADDLDNYNLIAEAGIDAAISTHWALRSSVRYQYDSSPAPGRQSDDTSLLFGLSYSLGGFDPLQSTGLQSIGTSWTTTTSLGLGLNSGNSESKTIALSFDSALNETKREILLNGKYHFAENNKSTDTDTLQGNAQYNHFLSERSFLGASIGYLRNQPSDISYRITPSASLGHYLIKNDEMSLSLEAGPGITFEEVGEIKDDYFSISAAEKFSWTINERTKFKQSFSAVIDPSNSENYSLSADAKIEVKVAKNFSWHAAASWAYDNTPADDRGKDDTTLTTGISMTF